MALNGRIKILNIGLLAIYEAKVYTFFFSLSES